MIKILLLTFFPLLMGCETSTFQNPSDTIIQQDSVPFKTYIGQHLIILYKEEDRNSVQLINDVFNNEYERICGLFERYPTQKLEVKLYPTMQMLFEGEHVYGYIAGIVTGVNSISIVSPGGLDVNLTPMNEEEQIKVVVHEFIHTQIHAINYNTSTWLNEGTAYYLANQSDLLKEKENFTEVLISIWDNKLPQFSDLEQNYDSFFRIKHSLSYSFLMVEFLATRYGNNSVTELIRNRCDFTKTIGISKDDFYKNWVNYLRKTYKKE